MKPYSWQKQLVNDYTGMGIVKGVPGSGKTIGVLLLIQNRKYTKVLIAVPTKPLVRQWKEELKKFNLKARVETFHKLYKPENKTSCDLLVVDECHRSTSPMFIKLYKYVKFRHVIGLSATPNNLAKRRCGPIIIEVPLQEANIANFKVIFKSIELNSNERLEYMTLSNQLRNALGDDEDYHPHKKKLIDALVYRRRSIVYKARDRLIKTIEVIMKNRTKNILVICQRIQQADELSRMTGFPVYHSKNCKDEVLQRFKDGYYRQLISVGMLKEGFDKRDINCLILVSTATTEPYHIQSIGRAIRLPDDAIIYILLANNTTDEKVLRFKHMYDHKIEGRFTGKFSVPPSELTKLYYDSERYNMDYKYKIFKTKKYGREYYKYNPIIDELKRYLPRGGRFRISKDGKVMVMFKNKIIVIDTLTEPLEASPKIDIKDLW